jgi:hypothetical protein
MNASIAAASGASQSGIPAGTAVMFDSSAPGGLASVAAPTGTATAGSVGPVATNSATAGKGGYVDVNVTAGYVVGGTFGVQLAQNGYFVYAGGALTSPPGGASITYSNSTASPGFAVGVQGSFYGSLQGGYSFGAAPGTFFEIGGGGPAGFAVTGYYVFGPFSYK